MNLTYGLVLMYHGTNNQPANKEEGRKWLKVSQYSMLLYLLNLGLIYICALLVFWVGAFFFDRFFLFLVDISQIKRIRPAVPKSEIFDLVAKNEPQLAEDSKRSS
jgi:hypothetical protein